MARPTPDDPVFLLAKAQRSLGMTQAELGELLGMSRRTIVRWTRSLPILLKSQTQALVTRVHPRDPALAEAIAVGFHETLESLGIRAPAPPVVSPPPAPAAPVVSPVHLTDSVVCAAAEAVGLSPQAIRPALVAAFERAAAVGLSVDDARVALASGAALADEAPLA